MTAGRLAGIIAAMIGLAALDIAGAVFAKELAERPRIGILVLGLLAFAVLFLAYALVLTFFDLSIVTMGWIVVLQVGLLALDWQRYGLRLDGRQLAAVVTILMLQCYLVVSTAEPQRGPSNPAPATGALVAATELARASTTPSTPYLVVDLTIVEDRLDQLRTALPGIRLHYAVKANPAREVLDALHRRGVSFDVASPAEIDGCLAVGASPRALSYGNTAKKVRDIEYAFARGVRVFTFDDASELDKLCRSAPGATVLCRLATSGQGADWALSTKFGCSAESAIELLDIAWRAGHPVGLAFHVGSQQRDPHQWDAPLATAERVQSELRRRGVPLSVLDIGGGFPAAYREPAPPLTAYGTAIRASLARHVDSRGLSVMAEPGRCLVADAGVIETEVVLVAQRGGARWLHLDIGLFGGLAEALDEAIQYRIETPHNDGPSGLVVLAGPTCDSVDVLYRRASYRLPLSLRAGDRVRLHATGAYTASYASVGLQRVDATRDGHHAECRPDTGAGIGGGPHPSRATCVAHGRRARLNTQPPRPARDGGGSATIGR